MPLPEPSTLDVQGRRVAFLDAGPPDDPAPVILLHGGALDRASLSWRHVLPALARDRRVIAPDWPGYGGSLPMRGGHGVAELGHWLTAFMGEIGVAQADMVGASMGGGVALYVAVRHPGRVRRLAVLAPYGLADRTEKPLGAYYATRTPLVPLIGLGLRLSRRATRRALERLYADPRRLGEGMVDEVMAILRHGGGMRAFGRFQRSEMTRTGLRTVLMDELHRVRAPTLMVAGTGDPLVPPGDVAEAARRIPGARLARIEAGHIPARERPDETAALLAGFLRAGERAESA